MFYSQHVLTRSGPLAKVWIAAHVESKLTKVMVFSVDIEKAIEEILTSEIPMALRLSSSLLLGVARIYKRKTIYLFQDSSEAMTRLKFSFRPNQVLSATERRAHKAKNAAITFSGKENAQPPNIDLSIVPIRDKNGPSPAYLASDRDITIDQFADRLAGEVLELFSAHPEVERADSSQPLRDEAEELLVFTPSQVPSEDQSGSPAVSARGPPSIETMRAPEVTAPAEMEISPGLTPAELPAAAEIEPEQPEIISEALEGPSEAPIPPQDIGDGDQEPSPEAVVEPTAVPRLSTGGDELELEEEPQPEEGAPLVETEAPEQQIEDVPVEPMEIEPPIAEAEQPSQPTEQASAPAQLDIVTTDVEQISAVPESIPSGPEEAPTETAEPEEIQPQDLTEIQPEQPSSHVVEGQEEEEVTERQAVRSRKRKATVLMDDGPTEMPSSRFRSILSNTADLVHPSEVDRPLEPTAITQRYENIISRPVVELAAPLNDFFVESFRLPDMLVASPMTDADLTGDQIPVVPPEEEKEGESEVVPAEPTVVPSAIEIEPIEPAETAGELQVPQEETPSRHRERVVDVVPDPGVIPSEEPSAPVSAEIGSMPEFESMGDMPLPMAEEIEQAPIEPEPEIQIPVPEGALTLRTVADMKMHVSFEQAHEEVTLATLSERTQKMHKLISENLVDGKFSYSERIRMENAGRRSVARTFYELLCLGSKKALTLSQESSYGDITATPLQPAFDSLAVSVVPEVSVRGE